MFNLLSRTDLNCLENEPDFNDRKDSIEKCECDHREEHSASRNYRADTIGGLNESKDSPRLTSCFGKDPAEGNCKEWKQWK